MAFDLYQPVTDPETGEYQEAAAFAYQDALMELFAASPEGIAYSERGGEIGWASMFLDYALRYLGRTLPELGKGDVEEVLFGLFPRKVSVGSEEASDIVTELRAFWSFLGRAYALPSAPTMLRLLDDKGARRLERELANPANFGMAKSIVMQGKERGFDTTTPEGLEAWMRAYNAELGAPPPLFGGPGEMAPPMFGGPGEMAPPPGFVSKSGARARKEKNRRKMAKVSRKQNRRK